ncbi:AsmA family protein [Methyloceanibacter sp.]|uniref:AsmA family protein n=1 Tax=Methyloceanibacter sp. TaxID=1965321 RepID=UPI003D6CAA7B
MLWSLAAIVAVGLAVVFVAPLFISAEDVRNKLFAEIEEATGYRLTVNGSLHISAFPTLKLVAEDVGVAQTKGAGTVDLATAKELRFGLAVAPLFSGKVQLTEIALIGPIVTMPEASPKTTGDKTAGAERSEKPGGGASIAAALQTLSLDSLRIEDGTLILRGEGGAPGKRIDGLNLTASLPAFDASLSLDVKARFDGQPLGVTGSISSFGPFLDGEAAQLLFDVDAPAYFPLKLALMGTATYTGDVLALDGLRARAGETTLRGAVSANLSGTVPQIKASLNGDSLNVDGLLGGNGKAPAGPDNGASGWSDAKIDFSGLKAVNAQVNLSVDRLSYGTIKTGPIGIRAGVAGGKLKLELPNFQLYGGVGTGVLSVDATGKTPVEAFRFSLSNLDAYPFLDDAAAFERIEGKAAIAVDLVTNGASQRAMVSALNGTAGLEFSDGAIRGINVAKMVRNLGSATLSGWQSGEAEKTDFASLGANFKIAQGKAQTSDLHLSGPLVRMAGAGTVDLPAQTLNFRVDPQVVASLQGQGGKNDLQGLGVPVAINGPWAAPSIYPDIAGILENPQAAYEKLSKLGGGLVKLPSADGLGGALSSTGGIAGLVKGKAGGSIEDLIQADQGSQGVVQGLGQLLGADRASTPAAAPPQSAAPQVEQPAKKKGKQKQAKAAGTAPKPVGSPPAQPAAVAPAKPAPKQFMQNIFGAF